MYPGIIIKQKRLDLGMTLEELSRQTAFSIGYLSKLERADSAPPLATLQKLAEVLDIDMVDLLNIDRTPSDSGDKDIKLCCTPDFSDSADEHSSQPLMKDFKNHAIVPFLMRVMPGQTEIFTHDAEEFLYVVEGEVTLNYKHKDYKLSKGDGAYIDSRKPHSFINRGSVPALVLTANHIYRRF